jgi:hypothetical protein
MQARAEALAAAQYSDICRPDQKKLGLRERSLKG